MKISLLFVAALLPVATLPGRAAPVSATIIAPQNGEIALEGTIEALDVVKNTLTLRATSLATPSSTLKKLPQAKTKAIQIGEATQFLENTGLKNLSLGDLEKGLPIRVVGRELVGKPFAARVVAWTAPAPQLPLDPLTPREKAPFLPALQTQNGITLRVIDAGWMSLSQMWPGSPQSARPLFYVAYALPGASIGQSENEGWGTPLAERNTRLLRVSGPNGETVTVNSSGPVQRENGIYGGTRLALSGVHPAWKSVTAEWETLDPTAPPDASGEFNSTLSFDKVPIPNLNGEKTTLGTELTTARGTKIILKSVRVGQHSNTDVKRTYFDFSVAPPTNVSDMKVELALGGVKNQDGDSWTSNGGGSSGYELNIKARPREDDTSLTATLKIKESAPSLRKNEWYRRFKLEIPVAAFAKFTVPPIVAPPAPLKVEGQAVALEIERESLYPGGIWDALVWIKSRAEGKDKTERWMLRGAKARAAGKETRGWTYENDYNRQFVRLSGAPAASNEHSNPLVIAFEGARPEKFDLELKLELARRLETSGWLRGVALPAPGASLDIREGQHENDSVRIKRIFWFKNGSELVGLPPGARTSFGGANLAVVVEVPPVFPGASVEIPAFRVQDDAGRSLDARQWVPRGDAGKAGTENTNLRTMILPVSSSSKSLDLWFHTVETAWSGQIETLVLKDIAGK